MIESGMHTMDTGSSETSDLPFNVQTSRKIQTDFADSLDKCRQYISDLESFVKKNGLQVPPELVEKYSSHKKSKPPAPTMLMQDGSLTSLVKTFEQVKGHTMGYDIQVQYRNLTFWNNMNKVGIPTVGSAFKNMFCGTGEKHRVDIIKDLSGRILPGRMTLVMGPPGCGKYLSISIGCTMLFMNTSIL